MESLKWEDLNPRRAFVIRRWQNMLPDVVSNRFSSLVRPIPHGVPTGTIVQQLGR